MKQFETLVLTFDELAIYKLFTETNKGNLGITQEIVLDFTSWMLQNKVFFNKVKSYSLYSEYILDRLMLAAHNLKLTILNNNSKVEYIMHMQ